MEYLKRAREDPLETPTVSADVRETVEDIIEAVRSDGDNAVLDYTRRFDDISRDQNQLTKEERSDAIGRVSEEEKRIIDHSLDRIQTFAEAQLESINEFEMSLGDGVVLGQKLVPIERVGSYVPGGEYPLLSSALMTVVPPAVAGVERIVVSTPPQEDGLPHPAVVYGAMEAGADEIFVMGGAQAVAAMAHGTDEVT
ncbi:histidinol dehydrogenase, partial [Halococcus hamelinensis]